MAPELLGKVKELVEAGATVVVGKRPTKSPSLRGYPECDLEVEKLSREIWGGGKVIRGKSVEEVLREMKIAPDFREEASGGDANPLRWIHRRTEKAEIYFVSSGSDKER